MNIYYLCITHLISSFIVTYYLINFLYKDINKLNTNKIFNTNKINFYTALISALLITLFVVIIHDIYYLHFNKHMYLYIIIVLILLIMLFRYQIFITDKDYLLYSKEYIAKQLFINNIYYNKTKNTELQNFISEYNNKIDRYIENIENIEQDEYS